MPDPTRLPEFENPPVVETVMAVRFREVPNFSSARIGQFWSSHLIEEFPESEDRPPYAAPVERFGPDGETLELQLKLSDTPPPTRAWFIGGNSLIQLQSDWFAYNWRKTDAEDDYIRFTTARRQFERWYELLDSFVKTELQKPLIPIQCEVTYVNHIELTGEDLDVGPLGEVIRGARPTFGAVLPRPEGGQVAWSYLLPDDGRGAGRLHLAANSLEDPSTGSKGVRMVLTARGRPTVGTLPASLNFFDLGHEWIVNGFKDVTTEAMWERWGLVREDNDRH